jgi:hypothetical protein
VSPEDALAVAVPSAFWLRPQWTGRDNLRDPGVEPFWSRGPKPFVTIPCPKCGEQQTRAPYYGFWCCSVCDWEADSYATPTPSPALSLLRDASPPHLVKFLRGSLHRDRVVEPGSIRVVWDMRRDGWLFTWREKDKGACSMFADKLTLEGMMRGRRREY